MSDRPILLATTVAKALDYLPNIWSWIRHGLDSALDYLRSDGHWVSENLTDNEDVEKKR